MSSDADGKRFLIAFNKLKDLVENDPSRLEGEMDDDSPITLLCREISENVRQFERIEAGSSKKFSENISSAAVKARREYDELWRYYVWYAAHGGVFEFFANVKDQMSAERRRGQIDETDFLIKKSKFSANINAGLIEDFIECARRALPYFPHTGDNEHIDIGLNTLDAIIEDLDVHEILWKENMLPHVLIPPHVAKRYGGTRQSLYRRLHDAGRAFIYGAPLAALAMQRAVLEEVLTVHWGAPKTGMGYRLEDANLPQLAWDARAARLKRQANDALHGNPEAMSSDELDRFVVDSFLLLRALIENAPDSRQAP